MSLSAYPQRHDPERLRELARLGVDREVERAYLTDIVETVAERFHTPFAIVTGLLSDAQVLRLHEAVQSIPDDRAISEVLDLTAPDWSCDDPCGRQARQPEKVTEQCS